MYVCNNLIRPGHGGGRDCHGGGGETEGAGPGPWQQGQEGCHLSGAAQRKRLAQGTLQLQILIFDRDFFLRKRVLLSTCIRYVSAFFIL